MARMVVRYSEAFKRKVVEDLETGRLSSREEARKRYGIKGTNTVRGWVAKYGSARIQARIIRVETPDEKTELKRLKARIADLERAVVDSKVQESLYKAYFEIVCRECGVKDPEALKKNIAEKLSREDLRKPRGR